MGKTLKSNIRPTVVWEYRNAIDLGTVVDDESLTLDTALTDGTGENQANIMWKDRRLVTVATPTDVLNLTSLVDVFGDTLTFVSIKAMRIVNRGEPDGSGGWTQTAGEDLLIGAGPTFPFDEWLNTDPDAQFLLRSGGSFVVTAPIEGWNSTAADSLLLITHDGSLGDIEYDIVLIGTDA